MDTVTVEHAARGNLFRLCKRSIQYLFLVACLPRLIVYFVARRLLGRRAFLHCSESISRKMGLRGVYLRQAFYRMTLSRCGDDIYFGWHSVFSMPEASIGNKVYIGRRCGIGFATIEDNVMLADNVQILSGGREHGMEGDGAMQSQAQSFTRVRIGAGAWIGTGAIVMNDVGMNTIVGAGAVVTKPLPSDCVAVGVPAVVIRDRLH